MKFGLENYITFDLFEIFSEMALSIEVNDATLTNGSDGRVNLMFLPEQSLKLTVSKDTHKDILSGEHLNFVFPKAFAPIKKGQQLGEIQIFYDSKNIGSFIITSDEYIEAKNTVENVIDFYNGLKPAVKITAVVAPFLIIAFFIGLTVHLCYRSKRKRLKNDTEKENVEHKTNIEIHNF